MENVNKTDAKNLAVSYAVFTRTSLLDFETVRVWWPLLIADQERTGIELVPQTDLESQLKRALETQEAAA